MNKENKGCQGNRGCQDPWDHLNQMLVQLDCQDKRESRAGKENKDLLESLVQWGNQDSLETMERLALLEQRERKETPGCQEQMDFKELQEPEDFLERKERADRRVREEHRDRKDQPG